MSWTGPQTPSMYQPSQRGLDALFARIEKLERLMRDLTGANILSPAGLTVHPEGLTIASELLVTGNTRIEGTLSLPAGIIDNAALANPVAPGAFYASVSNMAVGTSIVDLAVQTVTVPSEFTKAVVMANAYMQATNTNGSITIWEECRCRIASNTGPLGYQPGIGPGSLGITQASFFQTLTGLTPGSSFDVAVQGYAAQALAATAGNVAIIQGAIIWFR